MDPRTLYPKLTPFDVKFYLYQVLKADLAGQKGVPPDFVCCDES